MVILLRDCSISLIRNSYLRRHSTWTPTTSQLQKYLGRSWKSISRTLYIFAST
ncbi:hypothetical protein BDV34DRAFT_207446 [Aspergillus parasiticus]|uniref:Uncharacterized protein n=1 Tax=Aspergillus parasiticus TaxID=5067 RepID=A0A5N6D1L6_ASPPA|nr:hypothetical protein BDV34DRAFT_207446 [Aspergillus parasiticus]